MANALQPRVVRGSLTFVVSRAVIVALIVSMFPFATPVVAVGTDLVHTPPTGWSVSVGQAGMANPANVYDADDATQGNIDVGPGQGCTAVTTTVMDCAVGITFARSSGVTSFPLNSFRVKFAYCRSGWPDFGTCTASNTGISVMLMRVRCEENFVFRTHKSLVTGWNGISDTTQRNLDTACTIDASVGGYATVSVVMRINRDTCQCGSSVWWSLELYSELVPGQDAGSEKLGARFNEFSPDPVNLATGNFFHQATDLAMPGRLLGVAFTRYYNSADATAAGALGPGWTHSFNWTLSDAGTHVDIRSGDGSVDRFGQKPDLSYAPPFAVFDTLVKNGDATYTLTLTNQQAFAFSITGVLTRISEPSGNQVNLAYTSGKLTTITDAVGRTVTLSYDGANRLEQLLDPIGRKVTYGYDGSGRLITVTDKIGNAPGQTPADHQWHYAYDGTTRHLTTITDPDGRVVVTNSYDAQGRVYEQRDGLMRLTTFTYNAGQTVVTNPRGHATTFTFDDLYRVLSESIVVSGTPRTLSYTYDNAGNRDSVSDRNNRRTDFTYDVRGNLDTRLDPELSPGGQRYLTDYDFDTKNNLTRVLDARGFETISTYNATTNVKESTRQQITIVPTPTYALTKWQYLDGTNPGLPTRIISPRGNTDPLNPNYTYSQTLVYWPTGELKERIDADGNKTTFSYDGVSRQRTMVDPDGNVVGGDPLLHTWTTDYDENDRVFRSIDPLGRASLTGYDAAGNRTSATDRNGNVTTYTYDNAASGHGEAEARPARPADARVHDHGRARQQR